MNQPAKSHEPSMEEILASIRRIIADDDAKSESPVAAVEPPPPPPAPSPVVTAPPPVIPPSPKEFLREIPPASPPPPAPVEQPADILELTEDMRAPEPVVPVSRFTTVNSQPDVIFAEPEPEP